jgi:hypothetical protein
MQTELRRKRRAVLLAAWLLGTISGAAADSRGAQGLFAVKVDRERSGTPVESSPDPADVLAVATAVVGVSALELRCIEGRLSVVFANLGLLAKNFEPLTCH